MRLIEDAGKNGWTVADFGRPRATADLGDRWIVRSAVTALDSSYQPLDCLVTNLAFNCVLTTIEDVSGDAQGSMPILFSLLHVTQPLNQEFWSEMPFILTAGPFWSLLEARLQHSAFQTLTWPSRSADLSPIKPVWDMMGRRLNVPGNVDDLERQSEQIWQEIPLTIRLLYHSMPRLVAACIQARGGSTPY
ncbi:transposable element Tcb1 transposase [Trichonephila clavipes]|nr:transposable element Tcb1 transposase [Trichonephila clavipes]